ncbi:MAG TPA: 3-isopropylmalate dehydrogenase [Phycisphaerae bacterium]|nr:3-isopropylmalate dehydrogenase [Phycisphaerae bacterium]
MLKIAVIGGDGIGPEVIAEGLKVIAAAAAKTGFAYEAAELDISGTRYLAKGGSPKSQNIPVITDDEMNSLRSYDAVYFGAVGHPDIAPGILERGLLLLMRCQLDQYINYRPVKLYPGVSTVLANKTPKDINFVVIRENTEGLYVGAGGQMRKDTPQEIATQEMISTRFGAERCIRFAFEQARLGKKSGREGNLTLVHKRNVLTYAGDLWFRTFNEVGEEYPDIVKNYQHVDACCMYMATTPEMYDVVVTENMFGDIITDLGAAIAGGMGMAASGNMNPDPAANSVSMFEPVHGSAPDIAGQNKANPIAAIITAAMMLRQSGLIVGDESAVKAGDIIESAVEELCPKFSGQRMDRLTVGTKQLGDMVVNIINK